MCVKRSVREVPLLPALDFDITGSDVVLQEGNDTRQFLNILIVWTGGRYPQAKIAVCQAVPEKPAHRVQQVLLCLVEENDMRPGRNRVGCSVCARPGSMFHKIRPRFLRQGVVQNLTKPTKKPRTGQVSDVSPECRLPATVVMIPAGLPFQTRQLPESAMYRFPAPSTANVKSCLVFPHLRHIESIKVEDVAHCRACQHLTSPQGGCQSPNGVRCICLASP